MLQKQTLVPNWLLTDVSTGETRSLWDFRQKSHVVVLYDPALKPETAASWKNAIALDRRQWEWLRVHFVICEKAPEGVVPGVYAIDRYGLFVNYFPLDHWSFDALEREFIYYEARHC